MRPLKYCATALLALSISCTMPATDSFAQTAAAPDAAEQTVNISASSSDPGWWGGLPRERKMLYTNLAAATVIGIYGLSQWDYGTSDFYSSEEGMFEQDSKYGSADKVGHFYSALVLSDALTALYSSYGYDRIKANNYAAISSWSVLAFMELLDATSETQGFSWGDIFMNTVGALTSVVMARYPELDNKIDFRVEYVFENDVNNLFDDYDNHYYSMVLKLEGFESIENRFLKYLEFHAGYYSRGYDPDTITDPYGTRNVYLGISLNFSRWFRENGYRKTGKVLEYLQVPYTVLKATHSLD